MKKKYKPKYLETYYTIYYYHITDRVVEKLTWSNDDIDSSFAFPMNTSFEDSNERE